MLLLQHFTKSCSKCKELKNFSEFYSNINNKKYGLQAYCKICKNEINKKKKHDISIYNKKYRKEHIESLNEYAKTYRENNSDKIATYCFLNQEAIRENKKTYRDSKKEIISEYNKAYRKIHIDKIKKTNINYKKENKDNILKYQKKYNKTESGIASYKNSSHKRRARKGQGDVTTAQLIELQNNAKNCYWCGVNIKKMKTHIDHYVPLSKGGLHTIGNLVVSCTRCNLTKSAKDPIAFANSIGKLL